MREGFKNLIAWQKAYELAIEIYKITRTFPRHETYGLISQIRRAAVSISGNIAEGYERLHRKEYVHFLSMAKGSLGELETYLLFSRDLEYMFDIRYQEIDIKRQETARILKGLIISLQS